MDSLRRSFRSPRHQHPPDHDDDDDSRRPILLSPDHHKQGTTSGDISLEMSDLGRPPGYSFRRRSSDLRGGARSNKSRLLDPASRRSSNSRDVDDPFSDEDAPGDLRKRSSSSDRVGLCCVSQWIGLVSTVGALACSLTIPRLKSFTPWDLHLWKWEVLVLVVISGHLISGWAVRALVFLFEWNFLLKKRVLYFVYGVRGAVRNCAWLVLVLATWNHLIGRKLRKDEGRSKVLAYVSKVLLLFLVATLARLVKTVAIKALASSFHVNAYFDRIQESLFSQYLIRTLSGPPLLEAMRAREEKEKILVEVEKLQDAGVDVPREVRDAVTKGAAGDRRGASSELRKTRGLSLSGGVKGGKNSGGQGEGEEGITIDHLNRLNRKNVSAWSMKRLMNIVRYGAFSTLEESISGFGENDDAAMEIRTEQEAKEAAKKIFANVARPGAKGIHLTDLMRFMEKEEAIKTMNLIGGEQEPESISKRTLKNWLVNAFRDRKALSLTLNDTKTAIKELNKLVNVILAVILLFVGLLILGIARRSFLVFLSSQVLVMVFVFGNTFKTTFEAIVFLFVMHPYDVGDRCEIDGLQMLVEEINILTTVFLLPNNTKIIYPNSVLSTKPISNFYRSPDMGDAIDFCINVFTSAEKVALMKEKIKGFIESKSDLWYPDPFVILRDIEDLNRLKVSVWLRHRMNYQDIGERYKRRELVVAEMIRIFTELGIEYRMLPLDVNLYNFPASSSRCPSTFSS